VRIAGHTPVKLAMLPGQSRVFFFVSKNGLLAAVFSGIHLKWQAPCRWKMIFVVFVPLSWGFLPVAKPGHVTSIGTLRASVIVGVGIIWTRKTNRNAPRPHRAPFVPVVPVFGVLVCFAMMAPLRPETWIRLVVWLAIGLIICFTYGVKNSRLRKAPVDKR